MRIGNKVIVILGWIFLSSCNQSAPPGPSIVDLTVYLQVFDQNQKNLLDFNTPGFYSVDDIRIFYTKDGSLIEVYNPRLTFPRNFLIFSDPGAGYVMKLFVDPGTTNKEVTKTLIQWSPSNTDTIKSEISRIGGIITCEKVYYKNRLAYDAETTQPTSFGSGIFERYVTIKK